jgi:hypothetical protein
MLGSPLIRFRLAEPPSPPFEAVKGYEELAVSVT